MMTILVVLDALGISLSILTCGGGLLLRENFVVLGVYAIGFSLINYSAFIQ